MGQHTRIVQDPWSRRVSFKTPSNSTVADHPKSSVAVIPAASPLTCRFLLTAGSATHAIQYAGRYYLGNRGSHRYVFDLISEAARSLQNLLGALGRGIITYASITASGPPNFQQPAVDDYRSGWVLNHGKVPL